MAGLTRFHVEGEIKAGRLVPVLETFNPGDLKAIHAVFLGHGGRLPARFRALLDYLVENIRLERDRGLKYPPFRPIGQPFGGVKLADGAGAAAIAASRAGSAGARRFPRPAIRREIRLRDPDRATGLRRTPALANWS